jgi:hypothetical protein
MTKFTEVYTTNSVAKYLKSENQVLYASFKKKKGYCMLTESIYGIQDKSLHLIAWRWQNRKSRTGGSEHHTRCEIEGEGGLVLMPGELVLHGDAVPEGHDDVLVGEAVGELELEGEVDLGLLHDDGVVVVVGDEEAPVDDDLGAALAAQRELPDVGEPLLADPPHHGTGADHEAVPREPHAHPPRAVHAGQDDAQDVVLVLVILQGIRGIALAGASEMLQLYASRSPVHQNPRIVLHTTS